MAPLAAERFQSLGRDSVCSYRRCGWVGGGRWLVSIPRSGFCLFIPSSSCSLWIADSSFNPSVGILFVHTLLVINRTGALLAFQSLGRDSVCSYVDGVNWITASYGVSIPRSGFCLFIPYSRCAALRLASSFNPSVGILFVHTCAAPDGTGAMFGFQSLGRDSVCSYF